jgi:cytochrome P450
MTSQLYDPLNIAMQQEPYGYYRDLRQNHPVVWMESLQAYVVSRYDDVKEVLTNKEIYSSESFWDSLVGEFNPVPDTTWLISCDGPDHLRLRRLANKAFAPARFAQMKVNIETIIEGLLDDCTAHGDSFDFARDFAWLYPANVVAEILGVDPRRLADF